MAITGKDDMMERRGIVGAGNWVLDTVKTIDRWPPEGELAEVLRLERAWGGGPCNVLFDLAKLGRELPLYAAGCVGKDSNGDWLLRELAERNINWAMIRQIAEEPTSFTDVMNVGGKRTFFHGRGANRFFCGDDLRNVPESAKIVYLAYLTLLDAMDAVDPEYGTVAARALHDLQNRGFMTAVDLVSGSPEQFLKVVPPSLRYTDIFVINEIESGYLLKAEIRRKDGSLDRSLLRPAAEKLLSMGVKRLAAIHFPEGSAALTTEGEFVEMPSFWLDPKQIIGSNGAGDAFFAGLLYAFHEGFPLKEMLRCASASARFNLRHATASGGAPDWNELQAFLRAN